jgi:hypothetical protein
MNAKKIKVSINTYNFYDVEDEATAETEAETERRMFLLGDLDWDDLFSREEVQFEVIDDKEN